MGSSVRCKITGCDLDDCGVCRRCGAEGKAKHAWKEAERGRPCYRREVCERCDKERENPDHDWESAPPSIPGGPADLKCTRCGMTI